MDNEKTAFQAFVSSLVTVIVFVLSYAGFEVSKETTEKPAVVQCQPDDTYALFQQKLKATGSATKAEPVVSKPVVTDSVDAVMKSEPVVTGPVKVAGSRWNVEGNWNYSTAEIARHLEQVHGISAAGYSKSQLEAMHDNLHNGYPAMGYSSAPKATTYSAPTKTYSQPTTYTTRTGLFGAKRTYRTYSSSCPGGVCPQ